MACETIAVADIGGTHARFAFAEVGSGDVRKLGPAFVVKVADYAELTDAWRAFLQAQDHPAPRGAAFAVACPVRGELIKFTNNHWVLRRGALAGALGVDSLLIVNDFGAIGHAVAALPPQDLPVLLGDAARLPRPGVVSVVGPGTGLGVALTVLGEKGHQVIETEGGHIGFAPRDEFETALLARLTQKFGRVSAERVICGSGLAEIYQQLSGRETPPQDVNALWQAAIDGSNALARAALEKFCALLGGFCGDAALIHGANAVALGGGLAPRIAQFLAEPGFAENFIAKGRYREMLRQIPLFVLSHPQPGLFGAAAAFAAGR